MFTLIIIFMAISNLPIFYGSGAPTQSVYIIDFVSEDDRTERHISIFHTRKLPHIEPPHLPQSKSFGVRKSIVTTWNPLLHLIYFLCGSLPGPVLNFNGMECKATPPTKDGFTSRLKGDGRAIGRVDSRCLLWHLKDQEECGSQV